MHYLLFFEFLGTSELLVVLFVALIIFGPRKLPELGRSLGQAMHQVRNATNDFKRTWETEAFIDAGGGAAALTPSASVEHAAPAAAHAELVPSDATAEALMLEESHAPTDEALAPLSVPHAASAATYGES